MNPDVAAGQPPPQHGIARRSVLRGLGAGALTTGAGGVLAACTAGTKGTRASATSTVTLGYISPFTGSLAGFASGDKFVISTNMPNQSSLDPRLTAAQLASAFQAQTGKQWVQSIGSAYSLFEIAHQTFTTGVSDPHNKQEVASALHKVNYSGMCGPLNFASGPAPGVAIIAPVGVQWKASTGKYPFEMKVVDNSLNKAVKIGANLEPTNA